MRTGARRVLWHPPENGYIVAMSNPRSEVRPPKVARNNLLRERGIEFSG